MELYDCPAYLDKDTQTGLTIVENAAQVEATMQQRMLAAFHKAGSGGEKLYLVYKNLHIPAREARQTAEELVKAGLLAPIRIGRSEGYMHKDFLS